MRDTWDDTGAQPDPATATQAMWRSLYVWIRTSQDTTLIHQHEHQTPALVDNQAPGPIRLRIAPTAEEANGSFFFYGQGSVKLDRKLLDAWQKGGGKGTGFTTLRDGSLRITDPDGITLENILLDGDAEATLQLRWTKETPRRTFHVEATQIAPRGQAVGGVTYEVKP